MKFCTVLLSFLLLCSCATQEEVEEWENELHWSEEYIEDHCEACPECCVKELWDSGESEENE